MHQDRRFRQLGSAQNSPDGLHKETCSPRTPGIWSVKRIIDIPGYPPRVRNGAPPVPRVVFTPVTQAIQDGPPRGIQCLAHDVISIPAYELIARLAFVVALPSTLSASYSNIQIRTTQDFETASRYPDGQIADGQRQEPGRHSNFQV